MDRSGDYIERKAITKIAISWVQKHQFPLTLHTEMVLNCVTHGASVKNARTIKASAH